MGREDEERLPEARVEREPPGDVLRARSQSENHPQGQQDDEGPIGMDVGGGADGPLLASFSLEEAQAAGRLSQRLKTLLFPSLLVVDEIGYQSLNFSIAAMDVALLSSQGKQSGLRHRPVAFLLPDLFEGRSPTSRRGNDVLPEAAAVVVFEQLGTQSTALCLDACVVLRDEIASPRHGRFPCAYVGLGPVPQGFEIIVGEPQSAQLLYEVGNHPYMDDAIKRNVVGQCPPRPRGGRLSEARIRIQG